jgi:hypothetical protein
MENIEEIKAILMVPLLIMPLKGEARKVFS